MKKKNTTVQKHTAPSLIGRAGGESVLFFLLSWLWASWWMGDVLRIAYERSFFSTDPTLMHGLWQQSFGWLWYVGRALLTFYHWPLVGGLLVAVLLTGGSWLVGHCLRLPKLWRWLQYLPAGGWMMWTAHVGLNLFYMRDPGRILSIPFLVVMLLGLWAIGRLLYLRYAGYSGYSGIAGSSISTSSSDSSVSSRKSLYGALVELAVVVLVFAAPLFYLSHRHPYLRPLTKMQVQLLHNDYEGMTQTALEHADMSYRQMTGYYAIGLLRTGRLGEQLFDIKIEYDSVRAVDYFGKPGKCLEYHTIDCNYHAGLIRASRHQAVLDLTMDGPSLFTLKHLTKVSLIEGDWALVRKFLRIISKAPFEEEFIRKYEPMIERPDLVQADPEFAAIIATLPPYHVLENMYPIPAFLGYYASQRRRVEGDANLLCIMACLYSKRMPEFLQHCQIYLGTMPPRSVAEGLLTQVGKYPKLLQAFPQLELGMDRYRMFLQEASPYMQNREEGSRMLYDKYKGYYPYYYYFGNLNNTRKKESMEHFNAGVN